MLIQHSSGMKDFYYILGTRGNASADEIEAAYQKLARKFVDEDDAFMDAHFREISEAYDTLRDDRRRRKYDAALRRSQRRYLATFRLNTSTLHSH
ncbi:MAG TPA: DnaJ domain-containing protein [Mucilaginibacter sp.]|jgi:curved DNA-binding protein|nr:DnaJ domain-containing protein [Mucilaginibacter sp.]